MCIDDETAGLLEVCQALKLFDCADGDPRNFHTAEDGSAHRYVTLGFIGEDAASVLKALAVELRTVRASLPETPTPKLYIRTRPQLEKDFDSTRFKSRLRIAIPGVDWVEYRIKREGRPYPSALPVPYR